MKRLVILMAISAINIHASEPPRYNLRKRKIDQISKKPVTVLPLQKQENELIVEAEQKDVPEIFSFLQKMWPPTYNWVSKEPDLNLLKNYFSDLCRLKIRSDSTNGK